MISIFFFAETANIFPFKVVRARDVDHNNAWEKYCAYKCNDEATKQLNPNDKQHQTTSIQVSSNPTFVTPAAVMKKLYQDDFDKNKPKVSNGKGWEQTRNCTALATSKLYGSSARRSTQRVKIKKQEKASIQQSAKLEKAASLKKESSSHHHAATLQSAVTKSRSNELDDPHRQHANRLVKMTQMQERLRGQYLRFDIPSGLDDTASRFITAVALRYNFVSPMQSLLHGSSFICKQDKGCKQESLAYAESLIQQLHGQGLIFIRQLLPIENMITVLSSMNAPDEFITLASQLLVVLHQIAGGNYMSRRYLMTQCECFLTTQKELTNLLSTATRRNLQSYSGSEIGQVASLLAGFGVNQNDELDEVDIPGGLWTNVVNEGAKDAGTVSEHISAESQIQHQKTIGRPTQIKRPKTWAVAYTRKVLGQNDVNHPAYNQYRNYDLLTRDNMN